MKKLLLLLSMILITGSFCPEYKKKKIDIDPEEINLTIIEKEATHNTWKISGMAINETNYSKPGKTPWYIEASFDTTITNTTYLQYSRETKTINTLLESGDTLYWVLSNSQQYIIESDYPDFVIKNLHAYYYGGTDW